MSGQPTVGRRSAASPATVTRLQIPGQPANFPPNAAGGRPKANRFGATFGAYD